MDINVELFRKTDPVNRINLLESVSLKYFLGVTEDTFIRIIREVGVPTDTLKAKKHDKMFSFPNQGNNKEVLIDYIELYHKHAYISFVYKDSNITIDEDNLWGFLGFQSTQYRILGMNNEFIYFTDKDRAKAIKNCLIHYLKIKFNLCETKK